MVNGKKTVVTLLLLLLLPVGLFADTGGEAFAFLKAGAGSRATGMGGAFTSVSDDCSGSFYNPAGLVRVNGLQLIAETYFLSFGRSLNFVSTCKPFTIGNNVYSVGFSWINYSGGNQAYYTHHRELYL